MKRINVVLIFLMAWSMFMIAATGWADELEPADQPEFNATLQSRHIYSSDIEATDSEMDITTTKLGLEYEFKAGGVLPVEMGLNIGHKDINTDSPVDLPSHLESRNLKLGTKFPAPFIPDDRFFIGVDIFPTLNTDDWKWPIGSQGEESGAFRIPFRTYLIFKESDDFILVGGVSVRPEYEREVLPVLGVIYRPNDRLSFNLASDDPNISYKLTDATLVRWEFQYAFDEYEVTRGAQQGVVLQYQEISSGFGIEQQFNETLKGILSAGAVFNRQLEYKDEVGKVAPETGLYVGAQIKGVF